MKVLKTSAIVLAVSGLLSGAAFAQQGMSPDSPTRGGVQRGAGSSGLSAGDDTEMNSQAPAGKSGKTRARGTVGMSKDGAASSSAGATGSTGATGNGAAGTKRY